MFGVEGAKGRGHGCEYRGTAGYGAEEGHGSGFHVKGRDPRGGPRSGWTGGWRRLSKRLGAFTVSYRCH